MGNPANAASRVGAQTDEACAPGRSSLSLEHLECLGPCKLGEPVREQLQWTHNSAEPVCNSHMLVRKHGRGWRAPRCFAQSCPEFHAFFPNRNFATG
jgi:hypothetical protein